MKSKLLALIITVAIGIYVVVFYKGFDNKLLNIDIDSIESFNDAVTNNYNISINTTIYSKLSIGTDAKWSKVKPWNIWLKQHEKECKVAEDILIFDIVSMHIEHELDLLEIRIFEYTKYVKHFIIAELMHYTTGELRNESFIINHEQYIREHYKVINDNWDKIIFKQIYTSYPGIFESQGMDPKALETNVVEWDKYRYNKLTEIVYEECYKLYDAQCLKDNTFMILSDLDEIIRNDMFKILYQCSNLIHSPIAIQLSSHFYDFGCHAYQRSVNGKTKIVKLRHISFDLRRNNIFFLLRQFCMAAWKLVYYPLNITKTQYEADHLNASEQKHSYIQNGGWHLTNFGDYKDVLHKYRYRGHTESRSKINKNKNYQKCIVNVCGLSVDGGAQKAYRIPSILNNTNTYYPEYFQQKIYNKYPKNQWLKERFEANKSIYSEYLKYIDYKNSINGTIIKPEGYCYRLA